MVRLLFCGVLTAHLVADVARDFLTEILAVFLTGLFADADDVAGAGLADMDGQFGSILKLVGVGRDGDCAVLLRDIAIDGLRRAVGVAVGGERCLLTECCSNSGECQGDE